MVSVTGGRPLQAADIVVPGDPSSAAFFAAAAAALRGSRVEMAGVGLNPTRTAFLDVLRRFGAQVQVHIDDSGAAEPSGTLIVAHGESLPIVIRPDEVPGLIDELPVLAALGALGAGFSVRGAGELRVKESDRIRSLAEGLRALGAEVDERPDGITVAGGVRLSGARVDAAGDHRLAMAFTVAALGAGSPSVVAGADVVSVSYPGFFEQLEGLCQ
jgi:3-phosphoshikimate 1-carboxyvinyltransferase